MMKKIFLILGLSLCYPMSYQASLTSQGIVPAHNATDLDEELEVSGVSMQEQSAKNISKAARARTTGRIIGIIVLVVVALAIATVAFIFGAIGYLEVALRMGWITK